MLIHTDGIVLRKTQYGDHTRIVSIYTLSHGLLSFSVRGKKNGSGSLLSPLALVQLVSDIRNNRALHHLKEISMKRTYGSVPFHPHKSTVLLLLNELLIKVLKEEEANPSLFRFLTSMLHELDEQEPLHPSFHLSAILHLTRFLGFYPAWIPWREGLLFDLSAGTFHESFLPEAESANGELSRVMHEFITIPFEEYQRFRVEKRIRGELLDLLVRYYQRHIAGFGTMKSPDILREIYS
jgi:DNA repair protein RecO (recombination protein O)